MFWAQKGNTYGNPKWHWFDGDDSVCGEWTLTERSRQSWIVMPLNRRPGMARNNVCMHCKKRYMATRPDLQALFDRLNDKKDV